MSLVEEEFTCMNVRQSAADLKITQQLSPSSASDALSKSSRDKRGPPVVMSAEIVASVVPAGKFPR